MSSSVHFDLELRTATGPMRGRVAVPSGPMRLAELVPQALELADLLAARAVLRDSREGQSISCRAGCGACCKQMVPLSLPEVFHLADRVEARPAPERAILGARFQSVREKLEQAGIAATFLGDDYDEPAVLEAAVDYFRLGLDCPFLEAQSCGSYADRPTVCREYNVTTPARWCVDPERNPIRRVPMPTALSRPLARVAADLTGTPVRLVPLTLALRWAEEHHELGTRTWPGPVLFKAFVRHLSGPAPPAESL